MAAGFSPKAGRREGSEPVAKVRQPPRCRSRVGHPGLVCDTRQVAKVRSRVPVRRSRKFGAWEPHRSARSEMVARLIRSRLGVVPRRADELRPSSRSGPPRAGRGRLDAVLRCRGANFLIACPSPDRWSRRLAQPRRGPGERQQGRAVSVQRRDLLSSSAGAAHLMPRTGRAGLPGLGAGSRSPASDTGRPSLGTLHGPRACSALRWCNQMRLQVRTIAVPSCHQKCEERR